MWAGRYDEASRSECPQYAACGIKTDSVHLHDHGDVVKSEQFALDSRSDSMLHAPNETQNNIRSISHSDITTRV